LTRGILPLLLVFAAARETAAAAMPEIPVADGDLRAAVRPFPPAALSPRSSSPRNQKLLDGYAASIRAWGDVVATHFRPVPGHPGWGYYGLGGHTEDEVRPIAYAVLVNAFLSEASGQPWMPETRRRLALLEHCAAALRYLTQAHVSGGGRCVNGKPWGGQWQSAMWARSAGLGAWIAWPRLDPPLQLAAARMVEHEADRFLRQDPRNSEFGNTGAEENAWNAMALSLACNMMPAHPRASRWDEAAKRYMYNSISVAADQQDDTPGDDGRPVNRWVATVNAHPDFTVENHGLVHVGYLKLTMGELIECATHYLAGERPVPKACLHHVPDSWGVLLRCMDWEGAPIYFGGNDWKVVHTQNEDVLLYAGLSLLHNDGAAAYLEQVALDTLSRMQQAEGGFYNVRRDLEFGGFAAARLIACFVAHALRGPGAEPVTAEQFNRSASGVASLKFAQAILHRTPTKFSSFAWGPKRMALAMPENGNWVVWPHFASYLGLVDGRDSSSKNARLDVVCPVERPGGFSVIGRLIRQPGDLCHEFACISPPGDWQIYIERWTAPSGDRLPPRETGVIGLEYPLGQNTRQLHGRFGTMLAVGTGGTQAVRAIPSDWLNVDDRIGYVIRRQAGRPNVIRFHDETGGAGRVPQLQEWLSLAGDPDAAPSAGPDWSCIVTCLNRSAAQTAALAETISFEIRSDRAICRIPGLEIVADFGALTSGWRGP